MDVTVNGTPTMKLVLVGDGGVGKTSMLISYTTDTFPSDYVPTVFDNYLATIKFDNQIVKMWLWDTAGQEQYKRLRPLAYPKTDVFLICFSMIDPKSFTNAIRKWLPEVNDSCPNAIKIFVGTKSDMLTEYEYMLSQRGQPLTLPKELMEKKIKGLGYKLMTCSAMIQDNLTATFDEAIKMFLRSKNMSTIKKRQDTSCILI